MKDEDEKKYHFMLNGDVWNSNTESMQKIIMEMNEAYEETVAICESLTSNKWKGDAEEAFCAYMQLLEQYLGKFVGEEDNKPLKLARDAIYQLGRNVDEFYQSDFKEYRKLGTIR